MARHKRRHHRRHHARRHHAKRGKMTPQRRKFKAAVHHCWAEMRSGKIQVSPKSLGKCMKKEL